MVDSQQSYVVDTNVLIDFNEGGVLEELFRLPFRLITPDAIVAELEQPDGEELLARGLIEGELDSGEVEEVYRLVPLYRKVGVNDLFAL